METSAPDPLGCDIWFDLSSSQGPDTIVTPAGDWKLVSGRECYRQSLIRRFITKPGEWRTKPSYGGGLSGMVRKKLTTTVRDGAINAIRAQALQDGRTGTVDLVEIARLTDATGATKPGWRVHVVVTPKVDPVPLDVWFPVAP
jgi:phage baseplate assembly protein W